jgi:hypothetical protein
MMTFFNLVGFIDLQAKSLILYYETYLFDRIDVFTQNWIYGNR